MSVDQPQQPTLKLNSKKGNSSWKPANVDQTFNKEKGYRYRWINEDENNVLKKKMEQWEVVSDLDGSKTTSEAGYGRIDDGKPLTSVRKRVGQILARIPEEVAQERDAYVNAETDRRTQVLFRNTKTDLGKDGAPIHGSITMEKRGIRTSIKE